MKRKLLSVLIGVVMLSALGFGAFTASGTAGARGTLTKIGATHSWYLANANYRSGQFPGNKVYFDIIYTAGDETSVAFNIGYLYGTTTPAVANISYFPEANSSGQFGIMPRTLLKSVGNQRYTVSVEVPDAASYVVITFSSSGGTPTGTIVAYGYMNSFN
jgi:hypothetical protein